MFKGFLIFIFVILGIAIIIWAIYLIVPHEKYYPISSNGDSNTIWVDIDLSKIELEKDKPYEIIIDWGTFDSKTHSVKGKVVPK